MDLSDGDPITILHIGSGTTSRGTAQIMGENRVRLIGLDGHNMTWFLFDEEGDRWVRGHGEEIERALQAAALLRKGA